MAAWWGATCRRRRRQERGAPSMRAMAIDGAARGRMKTLQSRVEKPPLKNPLELVKEKEAQITQLRLEISALRVAISLLLEEEDIKTHKESTGFYKQAG
jgi:hypothetical protein